MQRVSSKTSLVSNLLAFACGAAGELYVAIPGLGFLAMLDVVSYVIAPLVIISNWGRMGKSMRTSLIWAFAWTISAMLANFINFHDVRYWAKCVSVVSSSWAMIAAAYLLLRRDPSLYLWYLVGTGLGGWLGLYHFRNGAFVALAMHNDLVGDGSGLEGLVEKQIYPFVARGIVFGCVLPFFIMWRKLPVIFLLCGIVYGGFYLLLHGGSRSTFGTFVAAALVGFAVNYFTQVFRKVAKSPMLMMLLAMVGGALVFGGYKYMASSGKMGEGEKLKLEKEFGKEGSGAISGRAGFDYAIKDAFGSFGIGIGTHLRCHSVMANSLACEGLAGFFFWVFFYWQVFWFLRKRVPYTGRFSSCIFLMVLSACWDVFGSPFGGRHKFFVLMALIALSRDNPYYGAGTLYDEKYLRDRRNLK